MKITSKSQFYKLWHSGLLGNRPASWPTFLDFRQSGFEGLITIRYRGSAGGGIATTHVAARDVERLVSKMVSEGADPSLLTFHESMPDHELLLQGEVSRLAGGLSLSYSTAPNTSMREAMKVPSNAIGLRAKLIVDQHLDPSSRDDLETLLDLYEDAVVEFGTYERDLGILPNRNTVIWEVRNY